MQRMPMQVVWELIEAWVLFQYKDLFSGYGDSCYKDQMTILSL